MLGSSDRFVGGASDSLGGLIFGRSCKTCERIVRKSTAAAFGAAALIVLNSFKRAASFVSLTFLILASRIVSTIWVESIPRIFSSSIPTTLARKSCTTCGGACWGLLG